MKQPWSNGRVATFGGSYCGYTQWATATESGDCLRAMITDVPAFGWYPANYVDNVFRLFLNQALEYVPRLRTQAASEVARRHQYLVIGPWGHSVNETGGPRDFGPQAQIDRSGLIAQWCRQWLKDEDAGVDQWPFVRLSPGL